MCNRFVEVHATTATVAMAAWQIRLEYRSVTSITTLMVKEGVTGHARIVVFIVASRLQVSGLTVLSFSSTRIVLYEDTKPSSGLESHSGRN
jgi:hypothetical protein